MSRPQLNSFGLSDIGLSRSNNEDVWVAMPDIGFFALADGMGGHQAGEVAAKEAIENILVSAKTFSSAGPISCPDLVIAFRLAIEKANRRVYELGQELETLSGMGTTLCCLYWTEEAVIYGHVGDSRIYRFRNQKLEQLTHDHSLLARWMARIERVLPVGAASASSYPYKNVITRAVGTSRKANPEIAVATYEPGDLFLLCSDGLSDTLAPSDIEKILERSSSLEQSAAHLIEKAKIKGSSDNITVLLVSG
ncbi:MAG: serine/threonine-protein phosphatase [Verrucomicrobiota bacterium]|nr:serine/threonine-protein phosphatase [Verrucomicrobiota bacterium]